MEDHLKEVLSAIEKRAGWHDLEARVDISLISYSTLSCMSENLVRELQAWTQQSHGVLLRVVGGKYGCSRIDFEVLAESAEEAANFTRRIIGDKNFQQKALSVGFRVLIRHKPYTRIDLARGTIEGDADFSEVTRDGGINMSIDQSTKIEAPVTNSNLAVHSSNVTQTICINPELENILNGILEKAETDNEISKKEYLKVADGIKELRAELSQTKPRRSVVEKIVSNLGSVASLASLVNQMAPFLTRLV